MKRSIRLRQEPNPPAPPPSPPRPPPPPPTPPTLPAATRGRHFLEELANLEDEDGLASLVEEMRRVVERLLAAREQGLDVRETMPQMEGAHTLMEYVLMCARCGQYNNDIMRHALILIVNIMDASQLLLNDIEINLLDA